MQKYISFDNSCSFENSLTTLISEGWRVVTMGTTLEKANYSYEHGGLCHTIVYDNLWWALLEKR